MNDDQNTKTEDSVTENKSLDISLEKLFNQKLNSKIRKLLRQKGITLQLLSKQTEISYGGLSARLRNDSGFSIYELTKIAVSLNITVSDIMLGVTVNDDLYSPTPVPSNDTVKNNDAQLEIQHLNAVIARLTTRLIQNNLI